MSSSIIHSATRLEGQQICHTQVFVGISISFLIIFQFQNKIICSIFDYICPKCCQKQYYESIETDLMSFKFGDNICYLEKFKQILGPSFDIYIQSSEHVQIYKKEIYKRTRARRSLSTQLPQQVCPHRPACFFQVISSNIFCHASSTSQILLSPVNASHYLNHKRIYCIAYS